MVVPTESAYGLATDAFNALGLNRLREAKNRGPQLPVPVMIGSPNTLDAVMAMVTAEARELITAFWPGQLTLVGPSQPTLSWTVVASGDTTISVRMPIHPVPWQLAKRVGPLALTGANVAGADLPKTCDEVADVLGTDVSVYLDGGTITESATSTTVDVSTTPPTLLREGALTLEDLQTVCPTLVARVS